MKQDIYFYLFLCAQTCLVIAMFGWWMEIWERKECDEFWRGRYDLLCVEWSKLKNPPKEGDGDAR